MEQRIFSDSSIPAFFQATKKPFKVTPQRNNDGQVEFFVEGQGIDEALSELFENVSVGALDSIAALKTLRSSIFALKGGRDDH